MLLPFLLVAAQIAGAPPQPTPQAPGARLEHRKPVSKPQAEAAVVAKYNKLVAAVQEFSAKYNSSHTVNAKKAQEMRHAWEEFEAAEADYREFLQQQK